MKKYILQILCLLVPSAILSQNIQVDSQTYSPQQLVEDILIDSNCIENVVVTNVVGGNFGTSDRSYGYFNANGSSFPFASGIVLSTGKIANAQGPNTSLSDDDAPNWIGDNDLESALNEQNTINATILEFDFNSVASQISFRYLFASEEYQENNSNTCQYSDLFGFLIRPANQQQYTNIALVPNTQTPVKVTTVHPEIPGGCAAQNEAYFGSWNGPNTPINFNGQTRILTATADVVPNQTYHVKLVIADEQNYRYDSAVFLEAGSFHLSTDLGPDLLIANNSALCSGDTYQLNASSANATGYTWFKDGVEIIGETNATYTVSAPGTYDVEVVLGNSCISYGTILVEYAPNPATSDTDMYACDLTATGMALFDLFDAVPAITNNDASLEVFLFFPTLADAIQGTSPLTNPSAFQSNIPLQTVYAQVTNSNRCISIAAVTLHVLASTSISIPNVETCDDAVVDGFTEFNLNDITATFQSQIPANAVVNYYETEADAINNVNSLSSPFQNTQIDTQTLFVNITSPTDCFAIASVTLNVLYTPTLEDDETVYYCEDAFPEILRIYGGVIGDSPSNYYYEWLFNGNPTSVTTSFNDVNETGIYTVIVTDPNGCSATRTITVSASNMATIENIAIEQGTFNNTVTVTVSGDGFYDYALDDVNGFYQESNVFTNVQPGFHTLYVRDRNGCGIAEQLISVLGFPRYFTPNGDPYHETWKVYGVNAQFNQGIDIKIFNRYGKLLAQQNHLSAGWDGTFKGKPLPSDDYWFVATLPDGRIYRGHFALVR